MSSESINEIEQEESTLNERYRDIERVLRSGCNQLSAKLFCLVAEVIEVSDEILRREKKCECSWHDEDWVKDTFHKTVKSILGSARLMQAALETEDAHIGVPQFRSQIEMRSDSYLREWLIGEEKRQAAKAKALLQISDD